MIQNTISTWHQLFTNRNTAGLDELIADNAVFHSPIVHTPQVGKELTKMYLSAAFYVFYNESFVYVRQVIAENHAVLEFEVTIDGIKVNGVDMITCDEEGKIIDFKVMVRPLKAVNLIHQKMMEMLQMKK